MNKTRVATTCVLALGLLIATGCESQQSTSGSSGRSAEPVQRKMLDLEGSSASLRQRAQLEWSAAQQMAPAGSDGSKTGEISADARETYLRAGKYFMAASNNERDAQRAASDELSAAHAYIRAGRARDSLAVIMPIANNGTLDDAIRAQALFRAYQAHNALGDGLNADLAARRLQYDYPLSQWARMLSQ